MKKQRCVPNFQAEIDRWNSRRAQLYAEQWLEDNQEEPLPDDVEKFFCGLCKIPLQEEPYGFVRHCYECNEMLCSICVRPMKCPAER